ncbi:hypothetical protein GUJ93_ZPchr0008g13470 [Zizania palustris]|nr:hypothetical protein GUJ93_ZPchr0008g13470 [Zizania palustris]
MDSLSLSARGGATPPIRNERSRRRIDAASCPRKPPLVRARATTVRPSFDGAASRCTSSHPTKPPRACDSARAPPHLLPFSGDLSLLTKALGAESFHPNDVAMDGAVSTVNGRGPPCMSSSKAKASRQRGGKRKR